MKKLLVLILFIAIFQVKAQTLDNPQLSDPVFGMLAQNIYHELKQIEKIRYTSVHYKGDAYFYFNDEEKDELQRHFEAQAALKFGPFFTIDKKTTLADYMKKGDDVINKVGTMHFRIWINTVGGTVNHGAPIHFKFSMGTVEKNYIYVEEGLFPFSPKHKDISIYGIKKQIGFFIERAADTFWELKK